jgi:hypothetical protein
MLLFIFILLQIADVVTTVKGLKAGAKEANPLLAWAFEWQSPVLVLLVAKTTVIVAVGVLNSDVVTAFGCGVYVPVIANNIRVLRKKG